MRIEININKKHFYILFTLLSVLGLIIGVTAYTDGGNPIIGGHTVGEIDWSQPIPSSIEADGDVCNGEERCIGDDMLARSCYWKQLDSGNRWRTLDCNNPNEFVAGLKVYDDDEDWGDIDSFKIQCCKVS